MGSTPVVPDGFQLDDVPEGFKLDEPVQPPERPGQGALDFIEGAVKGGARAAASAVNPVDYARAAAELARFGYRVVKPPVLGQPYDAPKALEEAATGARDIAKYALTTPEAAGEVVGSTAVGLAAPGVVGKTINPWIASVLRRSRVSNIVRAVKGGDDLVPVVEAAGDAARLPVSVTQGQLARRLTAAEQAAGEAVGATRDALPGVVPSSAVAGRLPEVGQRTAEGEVVTGARPLRRNIERTRAYYEGLGEPAQPATDVATGLVDEYGAPIVRSIPAKPAVAADIPRSALAGVKEEAQGEAARGGVYTRGRLGHPISPGPAASAEEATAVRSAVLDKTGLSAADAEKVVAYEKALAESALAKALEEPARLEHIRRVRGAGGGDWKAALAGRVVAPAALGGLATAGVSGMAASPLGALAGIGVAEFMRSTPWQTLSAATKLKAIRALESGGVAAFREVAIPAVIANTERRRLAESALRAQGEGVTTP